MSTDQIKPGDRVRVTIEATVVRSNPVPASENGTPAWTNLQIAEHIAHDLGDPRPSYFTLELPADMDGTDIMIERIS